MALQDVSLPEKWHLGRLAGRLEGSIDLCQVLLIYILGKNNRAELRYDIARLVDAFESARANADMGRKLLGDETSVLTTEEEYYEMGFYDGLKKMSRDVQDALQMADQDLERHK